MRNACNYGKQSEQQNLHFKLVHFEQTNAGSSPNSLAEEP